MLGHSLRLELQEYSHSLCYQPHLVSSSRGIPLLIEQAFFKKELVGFYFNINNVFDFSKENRKVRLSRMNFKFVLHLILTNETSTHHFHSSKILTSDTDEPMRGVRS